MKMEQATPSQPAPAAVPRVRALAFVAAAVVLCLALTLGACGDQNVEAQAAIDSARTHLTRGNSFYARQMEQTTAWREAYIAAMGPPSQEQAMAKTVSFLDAAEEAIASRVTELQAARAALDSVATLDADATFAEQARLLGEIVEGELVYCEKHREYIAGARRLSNGGIPPDQETLDALEALRVELGALADAIDAEYKAFAAYAPRDGD